MKRTISGLIVFILGSLILLHLVLLIGGFKFYYVKTGSMEPELKQGSLIYVRTYKEKKDFYNNVGVGMDISYRTNGGDVVTHRIVSIDEENDKLTTQGIVGDAVVEHITYDQVIGRVVYDIPYLGYAVMIIQTWYFWVILGSCVAIAFVSIKLVKELKKEDTKDSKPKNKNKKKHNKNKNKK